jgi:hypothetical protein
MENIKPLPATFPLFICPFQHHFHALFHLTFEFV